MIQINAPDFTLKDQNGADFKLYDNLTEKILLVFYPKDGSYVCSNQLSEYTANSELFKKHGIQVYGISRDTVDSHKKFCESLKTDIRLLSDETGDVCRSYEAVGFLGMPKRKLVLIDETGKVRYSRTVFSLLFPTAERILDDLRKANVIPSGNQEMGGV
ncbi:MAG: peroxiredoxin [Ignavibacteriaceae bacterium]|nr:peroxiredoxin [Ignavibacteriaceae bacterium]